MENKEWHCAILVRGETKRVKSAHESEKRLDLSLGDLPVLLEEEQRKNTGDAFSPSADCKFSLVLVVEATACILAALKLVDGRLEEAIETHEGVMDFSDDQPRWVVDRGLRS